MKKYKILFQVFFFAAWFCGCSEDSPLDDEQYIKQAYIVGADETSNMGIYSMDVAYTGDGAEVASYISVATGGSLNIDRDVTVSIKEAGTAAIEDYNFKYLDEDDVQYQLLNEDWYRIPDYRVIIRANEVYSRMPVYISPDSLNCDSLYALTFQIESVDDPDYISIRETDTVLILTFNMVNDYSGTYQAEGYHYLWTDNASAGDSISLSTSREFTAVDANTVRLYHLAITESKDTLDHYGLTFTVESDNSVLVASWGELEITDGGGTYNATDKKFTIWYNYITDQTERQLSATYTMSD